MTRVRFALAALLALGAAKGPPRDQPRNQSNQVPDIAQDPRVRELDSELKVYGGKAVPAGAYLFTVGIVAAGQTMPSCTGSLIDKDMVLTAAHCACAGVTGQVYVGTDPKASAGPLAGRYYPVSRWRARVQCAGSVQHGRDIALLKLAQPVTGVAPIGIANDRIVSKASGYRVVGFGAVDQSGQVSTYEKREAPIVRVSNACNEAPNGKSDSVLYGCQPGDEIVAGQRESPDSCKGDSGGPLLVTGSGTAGSGAGDHYALAGVTSRSIKGSPKACGFGGIYERLNGDARNWIISRMWLLRS